MDRWRTLQMEVVPLLRTYAHFNVWIPSCGSGHEAWAMATLLKEARLSHRARIYATDASDERLTEARSGWMVGSEVRALLLERIVFAQHNLDTDASFNEFALIFCPREELRPRAQQLFHESLCRLGILSPGGLGEGYEQLAPDFFRKVR